MNCELVAEFSCPYRYQSACTGNARNAYSDGCGGDATQVQPELDCVLPPLLVHFVPLLLLDWINVAPEFATAVDCKRVVHL